MATHLYERRLRGTRFFQASRDAVIRKGNGQITPLCDGEVSHDHRDTHLGPSFITGSHRVHGFVNKNARFRLPAVHWDTPSPFKGRGHVPVR